MEKATRKIYQPNEISAMLINGACDAGGANLSAFTNDAIEYRFTPCQKKLRKETEFIFRRVMNREEISPDELKATLARCVELLKNYPISDVQSLEQIFIHFTYKRGRNYRYDYIQLVDSQQDDILHRLNEILKTVDDDFVLGCHEFGERSKVVFDHWDELCNYSEIYVALSTIIELEDIYYPLSVYRTVYLIKRLDEAIMESNIEAIKTPYPTNLSMTDRYYGIRYEMSTYLTDNAYVTLSGDTQFEHMSDEIRQYYDHFNHKGSIYGDATQEDLDKISAIEQEGRMLFRRLSKPKK